MSIAGGLHKAVERGEELGCEAMQIFVRNSRTWQLDPLTEEEIRSWKAALGQAKSVKRVVAHNSYLLNLSTANEEMRKKSVRYFIDVMEKCEALGVESLITHPGSHLGAGEEIGLAKTAESIDEVLGACRGFKAQLLLENTAGQGGCLGHCFEHLRAIVDKAREPERIGFCFDTQHAFAAGYDLRTREAYEKTLEEWDRTLSLGRIRAFHLNDALKDIGCRVDRHESIGKGFLGKEAFRPLVNDPRFADTPMCLETVPGDDCINWKRELKLLKGMRQAGGASAGAPTRAPKKALSPRPRPAS